LRHAALHARAEAFPLGLGVLTGMGVTAWRHALASVAPAAPARPATLSPASPQAAAMPALPARLAAELIHALAGLALTGP